MSNPKSFLNEFLANQLLDIGDDDGRFANLEAAAESLGKKLESDPWQLARYIRVGLDKNIPPEEPVLDEVEAAITAQWKLLRNKHKDRPISILRAVLWEAILKSEESDVKTGVIGTTARAESEFAKLGPEADLCEMLLGGEVERLESLAEAYWTSSEPITIEKDQLEVYQVSTKILATALQAACGPASPDGEIEGANPKWPSDNAQWASEFSQRSSSAIAHSINSLVQPAQRNLFAITSRLAEQINAVSIANSRKTDLLWWSQSKFCVSAARGFSDIPKLVLPFLLAIDVYRIAPVLCPQSVEHFLAHVIDTAAPRAKKATAESVIKAIATSDFQEIARKTVEPIPSYPGRCGILGAVKRVVNEGKSVEDIGEFLSLGTRELSLADFAKLFLSELQLISIAESIQSGEHNE